MRLAGMARLPNNMTESLKQELQLFLGLLAAALAAGLLTGRLLGCLLAGLLVYLVWHLRQLLRLPRLIAGRLPHATARPYGIWKGIFRELDALNSRTQAREGRLVSQVQNRFQDTVSALPNAVIIRGHRETIDWMNPAAEQLLGINRDDVSDQRLQELVRDPVLDEYLRNKDFDHPLIFSPPANRSRIVSLVVTDLGRQQQQLIIASDITRQYHLDAAQLDFVANISHELRTPLTVIIGLLEQLQFGNDVAPTEKRAIEIMQNQARRMNELIADLLTLSRLESSQLPPASDAIDVPGLLTDIADEARTLGKASGHDIALHIESADRLKGSRKDMHTALSSLVSNAIQHTPNRTSIDLRWQTDADGACLSVSDNGEGIASRHLPRLTERLYRVDGGRSRKTGGTGLGLTIARSILDRHGAELKISSTVGRGSTFSCHFPPDRVIRADMDD
jgi:two-component system phosphate regulon sensor histidine kinase PhoR